MHYEHGQPHLDALPLKVGDEMVLPSGRLGTVTEIGRTHITFAYVGAPKNMTAKQIDNWSVCLPRRLVAEILRG